jgi:AAA family ATP:ADP antiporter
MARPDVGSKGLLLLVDVRPGEAVPVFWACLYFFSLLAAYYIIRPLRDEVAVEGGVQNLPWLFTGTLVAMLLVNPLFGGLVAKLPRRRFISLTYRFFGANTLVFLAALWLVPEHGVWIGRVFYVWTSVFNLFVVSIFWSFMVDLFATRPAARLFGLIAAGGTAGGIFGSGLTAVLAQTVPPVWLLPGVVIVLEVALYCVRRLGRLERELRGLATGDQDGPVGRPAESKAPWGAFSHPGEAVIGGSPLAGIRQAVQSPYLLGISVFMLLFTVTATFLYFQQAEMVAAAYQDRAARTAFFARIDLAVNVLTMLIQVFLTGRLVRWLGVTLTLALLPAVSVAGFLWLGLQPTLALMVVMQVVRRAGNFAVAHPARELLYTVLPREQKYKAKAFIDTFVYRAGDQLGAWSYAALGAWGLTLSGVSLAAVPLSGLWLLVAVWLGIRHRSLVSAGATG